MGVIVISFTVSWDLSKHCCCPVGLTQVFILSWPYMTIEWSYPPSLVVSLSSGGNSNFEAGLLASWSPSSAPLLMSFWGYSVLGWGWWEIHQLISAIGSDRKQRASGFSCVPPFELVSKAKPQHMPTAHLTKGYYSRYINDLEKYNPSIQKWGENMNRHSLKKIPRWTMIYE